MRAGLLDAEDWRILEDGLTALVLYRAGWACRPSGPHHHSKRVDALIRAGLMERAPTENADRLVWTSVEGQRALAGHGRAA